MREIFDFRISEASAKRVLPDDVGEHLGDTVRRVVVASNDPLFAEICRLERELWSRQELFVNGWVCKRSYSRRELDAAELFHVEPRRAFEPIGEDCGTVYDDTAACDYLFVRGKETVVSGNVLPPIEVFCGVGARQVTPLFLDGRSIPRKVDFARTLAEELVVSARVREAFREEGLKGADFDPVCLSNKGGRPSTEYYQLKVVSPPIELDSSTRTGEEPFGESGMGPCPRGHGHSIGNRLLSEVSVQRRSLVDADLMATSQMIGRRIGMLRPNPILVISPKTWRAIEKHKLNGLTIEVAHVV